MPYTLEILHVGITEAEEVPSIKMPRDTFVQLVVDTIDENFPDEDGEWLLAELIPVAEKMPRFPLGTWINADRGCGCVVGEYLVATQEIDRHNLNVLLRTLSGHRQSANSGVYEMLKRRDDHGRLLLRFGSDIDDAVRIHVADEGVRLTPEQQVDELLPWHRRNYVVDGIWHDSEDLDRVVQSVEIID